MNVCIPILARRCGKPTYVVERCWRQAKRIQAVDGDKSNYLEAWNTTIALLEVPIKERRVNRMLKIGEVVQFGKLSGVITAYDAEFAFLEMVDRAAGLPIVMLYLTD